MQGAESAGSIVANRMGCQAPERLASDLGAIRLGRFVFAFHDGEEIGPKMLARIARHTGLRPEDL
jgi:hypothetical protein